jgi:hypothetical protein
MSARVLPRRVGASVARERAGSLGWPISSMAPSACTATCCRLLAVCRVVARPCWCALWCHAGALGGGALTRIKRFSFRSPRSRSVHGRSSPSSLACSSACSSAISPHLTRATVPPGQISIAPRSGTPSSSRCINDKGHAKVATAVHGRFPPEYRKRVARHQFERTTGRLSAEFGGSEGKDRSGRQGGHHRHHAAAGLLCALPFVTAAFSS